jgi:hypothetical protein
VSELSKIDFGKPYLQRVKLVRAYELNGVVFVEGYDKPVGFTFHSAYSGNVTLIIENVYQARDVYYFFRKLFKDCTNQESGLSKSVLGLSVNWDMVKAKKDEALLKIEKAMGSDWKDAFGTILSVYEK